MMESNQTRRSAWEWAALGLALASVLALSWRIHTYVTGQDPFLYIHLARQILDVSIDPAEWRQALFRVAPGYPLLLALAIWVGGDLAPYLVNPLLALVFVLLYFRLLDRWFARPEQRALALLGSIALLWTAYGLNPHFLLYPFRGLPGYTLVLAGYLILERAGDGRETPGHAVLAGCLLSAAALIREPLAVAAVGAFIWLLALRRWTSAMWLLVPALLMLFAAAVAFAATGDGISLQAWVVWRKLDAGHHSMIGIARLARQLASDLRWIGLVALAAGVWAGRRDLRAGFLHLLPGLTLMGFYGWFGPHPRYRITVLFFFCPLVMKGAMGWVDRLPRRARTATFCLFITLVSGWLAWFAAGVKPWGPRVTARQVRALQEQLPAEGVIYSEGAARYLTDAVVSYTTLRPGGHVLAMTAQMKRGESCYFARPLNAEALYSPILDTFPRSYEALLHHRWDLVPLPGMEPIALGQARYELLRVRPFNRYAVTHTLGVAPGVSHVVWLNLKNNGGRAEGWVRVHDAAERVLLEVPWLPGPSLRMLVIPGGQITGNQVTVGMAMNHPIPADPVHAAHPVDRPLAFDLQWGRIGSCDAWFLTPFQRPDAASRHVVLSAQGGRLCLPPRIGAGGDVDVLLSVQPIRPSAHGDILDIRLHRETLPVDRADGAGGQVYYAFRIPGTAGNTPCLALSAEGHLRLTRVRFLVH